MPSEDIPPYVQSADALTDIQRILQYRNTMDYLTLPKNVKAHIAQCKTPFFLFDLDIICSKIDTLHQHIHPDKIYYALKSNSLPPVLSIIASKGCGFDANKAAENGEVMT